MELTKRRFAVYMASGLALALLLGLAVWKIPSPSMNMRSDDTEIAGQPVAKTGDEEAAASTDPISMTEDLQASESGSRAATEDRADSNSNYAADPLAPPNARLDGAREDGSETSYYRPTNAAPSPRNNGNADESTNGKNGSRTPSQTPRSGQANQSRSNSDSQPESRPTTRGNGETTRPERPQGPGTAPATVPNENNEPEPRPEPANDQTSQPADQPASPADDNATPQGGNATPQGDNPAPQGGNATPQGGNAAPQGGNSTAQGGNASPQGGNATVQSGNAAPQSGQVSEQRSEDPFSAATREERAGSESQAQE